MFTKAIRVVAIVFAVGLIASSCSEPPASPSVPSVEAHRGGRGRVQPASLVTCSDLPTKSQTRTIGPWGGTISAGPHKLSIPRGALERPTEITMTVTSSRGVNEVDFEPEGLEFEQPVSLTMSYANCDISDKEAPYGIAYVDNALNFRYYVASFDDMQGRRVTGSIEHFSTYAVARRDYVIAW